MSKTIIIDGYNLAFASDRVRPVLLKNKNQGRNLLLDILAGYKKAFGYDITVVFDGTDVTEEKAARIKGIRVIFSKPPRNADRLIKDRAAVLKKTKVLTVVTSDRELAHYVKGRQVEVIGSGDFLERMEQELNRRGLENEKPTKFDPGEWMEYFKLEEKE